MRLTRCGCVQISANDALVSMFGVQHIMRLGRNALGWSLDIHSNPKLQSISKMKLQSAAGGIRIEQNPALKHVNGLSNLASVGIAQNGRSLQVVGNRRVRVLSFKSLKGSSGAVLVQNNSHLQKLAAPMVDSFASDGLMGRSIEIVHNPGLREWLATLNNALFTGNGAATGLYARTVFGDSSIG